MSPNSLLFILSELKKDPAILAVKSFHLMASKELSRSQVVQEESPHPLSTSVFHMLPGHFFETLVYLALAFWISLGTNVKNTSDHL